MPKTTKHKVLRAFLGVIFVALSMGTPGNVYGQQDEIPPATPEKQAVVADPASTSPEPSDRIVGGRPALYSAKRALHPVAWFEAGVRPILKLVESAGFDKLASEQESTGVSRTSGVKFGVDGMGSSSGFGPEITPYNKNLFNTGVDVQIPLLVTYKMYHSGRFQVGVPLASGGALERLRLELTGGYFSRASDNFFGIGNDSSRSDQSEFRSVTRRAGIALDARIRGLGADWAVIAGTEYRSVGITEPRRSASATAMDVFSGGDIPGLTSDNGARIVSATAILQRDNRDNPWLPDSGGVQRVEVSLHEGLKGGDFAFWQYRGEIQQYFPLTEDHRKVISFVGAIETNKEKGGSEIPFWDLPTVGSHSTVRGFESRRFADKSAVTATLEYRFRIWRHFDLGFFADAGQVAPEIRDFRWDRLHTGFGGRFIMRMKNHHNLSLEIAHTRETPWMAYLDVSSFF